MKNNSLSTRQQIRYVGLGISIGVFYVGVFMLVTNLDYYLEQKNLLPEADAQILPFEQQLEQIRDPKECTRKVVQGRSAEIPFTIKVFYDTTRDVKLEFKQQGTSFPIRQTTNQVLTFFTEEPDQYEIYVELNYDRANPRQVYIEYLSGNQIVQSAQEKFNTNKFCMTIFANTVKPIPVPTKEEIFGESLDYIAQIPAMVTAFNANSQTSATSIAYMWILLFAVLILSVITLINSYAGKRDIDSKVKDVDDIIKTGNIVINSITSLESTIKKPFNEMAGTLKEILALPHIKEQVPKRNEKSHLKKFMKIVTKKKKDEGILKPKIISGKVIDRPKTEADEVRESLEPTPKEIEEERDQMGTEPSGGFVQVDEQQETKEKVSPQTPLPKENNPMNLQPRVFKDVVAQIDLKNNKFLEGGAEKFTYTELNECFSWISDYNKWIEDEEFDVPPEKKEKQIQVQHIIYHAVLKKIDERNKI